VAIATVLAMAPSILVMDEPTASLDPCTRRQLIQLLAGFQHTKIIATHDLDMALDLCSRAIVLKEGRIVADGPTGELLTDEALLQACHLEKPLRLQACPVCSAASGTR
jgi:cobalt/nickel transport system ATP-binding protein